MSAVVISAVLLLVVTASSFTGFYGRADMLDAELKARSSAAADACVDAALLALMRREDPAGRILSLNSLDECRIGAVNGTEEKSFTVQATSSGAVTNLRIVVNGDDLSIRSWEEVATF